MMLRRLALGAMAVIFVAVVTVCSVSIVHFLDARRATDRRLLAIAETNKANGESIKATGQDIKAALAILTAATGPDAQEHQQEVLSGAIDELRLSTNCVALYTMGVRTLPCAEVDARMDALLAGINPFARKGPGG